MRKDKVKSKKIKQDILILFLILFITIIVILSFPDKKEKIITNGWNFFVEMILILPAVMILTGLFNVFISKENIVKYLGKTAGLKAIMFGIIMGSLPTGPLYVAFPLAAALLKKGARISCIIAFLSAWACIKIPQEMVEIQFLGIKFMALRLILTIIFVIIMGLIIEKLIERREINANI